MLKCSINKNKNYFVLKIILLDMNSRNKDYYLRPYQIESN